MTNFTTTWCKKHGTFHCIVHHYWTRYWLGRSRQHNITESAWSSFSVDLSNSNILLYLYSLCVMSCRMRSAGGPNGRISFPLLRPWARPTVTFPATGHHCLVTNTKLYCSSTEAHVCEQGFTFLCSSRKWRCFIGWFYDTCVCITSTPMLALTPCTDPVRTHTHTHTSWLWLGCAV